jgi:hypothetical protein
MNAHNLTKIIYASDWVLFYVFLSESIRTVILSNVLSNITLHLILIVLYKSELCTKKTYALLSVAYRNFKKNIPGDLSDVHDK